MTDRPCTCHPGDSPKQCALSQCRDVGRLRKIALAAQALCDEAQEYAMDFGLGCAAPNDLWEALWDALDPDPVTEAEHDNNAPVSARRLPPSGDTPAQLAEYLYDGARLVEAFHQLPGVARAMREAAAILPRPSEKDDRQQPEGGIGATMTDVVSREREDRNARVDARRLRPRLNKASDR